MIRRTIATSAVIALTAGLAPVALAAPAQAAPPEPLGNPRQAEATQVAGSAKGTVLSLGERKGREPCANQFCCICFHFSLLLFCLLLRTVELV